jgi:hypothetical protein
MVAIGIQAQMTLGVTNTVANSRARAVSTNSSNTQFAGFYENEIKCTSSLTFNFFYPGKIVGVKDRGQKEFMCVGISKTFRPVIISTWDPLDRDHAYLYSFKIDRNIYSIRSLSRESEKPKYLQSYVVHFLINHALSYIHSNVDTKFRGYGKKSIDRMSTKFPKVY